MRILIVGCGYVGLPLGQRLTTLGHEVHGLRRSRDGDNSLHQSGIHPVHADISRADQLARLSNAYDAAVLCASAGRSAAEAYRSVYVDGTRNVLAWLSASSTLRVVYVSSTGVYGQTDGSCVTEESPTEPGTATGEVLLEAERLVLAASADERCCGVVLRAAGIYGPGRGYWLRQFLSGEARLEGDGSRVLNMIHRDDVAGAIVSALEGGRAGEIYNVVDDEPVTQLALFQWLASELKRDLPAAVAASSESRTRGLTHKRVSNRKMRSELGCPLIYPTFREGMRAEPRRSASSMD